MAALLCASSINQYLALTIKWRLGASSQHDLHLHVGDTFNYPTTTLKGQLNWITHSAIILILIIGSIMRENKGHKISFSTLALRLHVCWINVLFIFLMFCVQSQKDPMLVEKIMEDLDSNKDNEVDFNEFVVLVAALTVACNDFFQAKQRKSQ